MTKTHSSEQSAGDRFVTVSEAAHIRQVHPSTLRRAAMRGELQMVKLSHKRVGFRLSEIMNPKPAA
jgi:hypothetical protein